MPQSFLVNYAVLAFMLIFQSFDSTYSGPTGFSMKMIMRDSPESPLYPGNLTELESLEGLVEYTQARVEYLRISTSLNKSVVEPQNDPYMYLFRRQFLFLVHFALGHPPKLLYLVMDTGGYLIWTQCLPCSQCYPQTVPLYDSSISSTHAKLPCSHTFCSGGGAPFHCVNNECVYSISYQSGERTEGVALMDAMVMHVKDGGSSQFPAMIFGCSKSSTGFKFANTMISGIMGLSFAPYSLMIQLLILRFSYCLNPFHLRMTKSSTLSFGDAIPAPTGVVFSTPLVHSPNIINYYFYLNLIDISVGAERLRFPPGTFGFSGLEDGGLYIDSGTAFTVLAQSGVNPYKTVLDAFNRYYGVHLKRATISSQLELCYEFPDGFDLFAPMTYHFQGADYVVDGRLTGIVANNKYFCVGIVPGHTVSILGAVHQQNTRFIYDNNARMLRFSKEQCS